MRQTPEAIRVISTHLPSIRRPLQHEWRYLWVVDEIPPRKVVVYKAYTIPRGFRLLLKGGGCFSTGGQVQKVWVTVVPGFSPDYWFTRAEAVTFEPSCELLSGQTLLFYFFNNSTKKCRGGIALIGVLEMV